MARNLGLNAFGAILIFIVMGDDGTSSMNEVNDAGARTIAHCEITGVAWGMPGEAVKHGGVYDVAPLEMIAGKIMKLVD